jgi:PhoH-like ATPase
MEKYFVLDTNVLLHDAKAIFAFGNNRVVVPIEVLEELDKFKVQNDELGRNARAVVRTLDQLRQHGSLGQGVPIDGTGGSLAVDLKPARLHDTGLDKDVPDNRILGVAWRLQNEGKHVIFVSKDLNLRIKADALGVTAMDFEKEKINIEQLYAGWREMRVPGEVIDEFAAKGAVRVDEPLCPNEFVLLRDQAKPKRTVLARRAAEDERRVEPLRSSSEPVAGVAPRNMEQRLALELLLDDSVPLVTLVGKAGTGKTLLALAAGYHKTVKEGEYEKILVSRPIMPLGRDIGYLPGTKDEKLEQWMKPIFDNLKFILREKNHHAHDTNKKIAELTRTGIVEMEALTYIRGRSIYDQFLIVDEAQNLTPHEVKTIISRAGDEAKLVLTGDPYQIDNPYLDSASNGLTYLAEVMKTQPVAGHVLLTKSERSRLAAIAAEVL